MAAHLVVSMVGKMELCWAGSLVQNVVAYLVEHLVKLWVGSKALKKAERLVLKKAGSLVLQKADSWAQRSGHCLEAASVETKAEKLDRQKEKRKVASKEH